MYHPALFCDNSNDDRTIMFAAPDLYTVGFVSKLCRVREIESDGTQLSILHASANSATIFAKNPHAASTCGQKFRIRRVLPSVPAGWSIQAGVLAVGGGGAKPMASLFAFCRVVRFANSIRRLLLLLVKMKHFH